VHGSTGFDAVEFLDYIREKRVTFPISCGIAILLALIVSLAVPKRYTAKSSILIEAPEGSDPRVSTAMSPAYLDSLKTYEAFARSDTLFQRAVEHLHVEGPKGSFLKVSRPAGTAVIEISATLRDPRKAQALAQFIAEQAVELDRAVEGKSAGILSGEQRRMNNAIDARDAFAAANPIETLENEVRAGFDMKGRIEQDLARARTDLAEQQAVTQSPGQLAATRARIQAIENHRQALAGLLEKQASQLDVRKSRRKALEEEEQAARSAYERTRAISPEFQGGRLRVIDPGVVPQEAGFPNTRLNVAAAVLASLIGTFAWLMVRFSYVRLERERSEHLYSLR
jgi:capsular polysaccharide biosynthesis protein